MVAAADAKPSEIRRARRLARMRLVGQGRSESDTEVEET